MAAFERNIQSTIIKHLETLPWTFCVNLHGGAYQRTGLPDIMVIQRDRPVAFIEVKRKGDRSTKVQQHVARRIRRAGGVVLSDITSWREARDELDRYGYITVTSDP